MTTAMGMSEGPDQPTEPRAAVSARASVGAGADATAAFAKALQDALASTPVKARMQALGVETMPGTPAQMAEFSRTERAKWGEVITKTGVKLD